MFFYSYTRSTINSIFIMNMTPDSYLRMVEEGILNLQFNSSPTKATTNSTIFIITTGRVHRRLSAHHLEWIIQELINDRHINHFRTWNIPRLSHKRFCSIFQARFEYEIYFFTNPATFIHGSHPFIVFNADKYRSNSMLS